MADRGSVTTLWTGAVCLYWKRWSGTVRNRLDSNTAPSTAHTPLHTGRYNSGNTSALHALRQLHSQAGYFDCTAIALSKLYKYSQNI